MTYNYGGWGGEGGGGRHQMLNEKLTIENEIFLAFKCSKFNFFVAPTE